MKLSAIATHAPRRRLIADNPLWPRSKFIAGPGGVGIVLAGIEGLAGGLAQFYFARSVEAMREQARKVDADPSEMNEYTQTQSRLFGLMKLMQGIGTFIVGRAASTLVFASMGVMKRSICATFTALMASQSLLTFYETREKVKSKKLKQQLGIQGLTYAVVAVLNCLGALSKGEPVQLKV